MKRPFAKVGELEKGTLARRVASMSRVLQCPSARAQAELRVRAVRTGVS